MNKTAIATHAIGGVLITGIVAVPLQNLGVDCASVIGATAAIFTYYGREQSQAQTKIARDARTNRQGVWWRGWTVFEWGGIGPVLEWVVPSITAVITAMVL